MKPALTLLLLAVLLIGLTTIARGAIRRCSSRMVAGAGLVVAALVGVWLFRFLT